MKRGVTYLLPPVLGFLYLSIGGAKASNNTTVLLIGGLSALLLLLILLVLVVFVIYKRKRTIREARKFDRNNDYATHELEGESSYATDTNDYYAATDAQEEDRRTRVRDNNSRHGHW